MSEPLSSTLSDDADPPSNAVLAMLTSNHSPLLPINCDNLLIDSQEDFLLNEIN